MPALIININHITYLVLVGLLAFRLYLLYLKKWMVNTKVYRFLGPELVIHLLTSLIRYLFVRRDVTWDRVGLKGLIVEIHDLFCLRLIRLIVERYLIGSVFHLQVSLRRNSDVRQCHTKIPKKRRIQGSRTGAGFHPFQGEFLDSEY